MINYRNINIFFLVTFVTLVVTNMKTAIPFYAYLVLALIYFLILAAGSYFIRANFFVRAINNGPTSEKEIALTFDDGPVTKYTPEILQILKEQKVEAVFFCIGARVDEHQSICRQIIDEGHLIGNHSYSHDRWFDLYSSKKMAKDLSAMNESLKNTTGLVPHFFRPPYGVTNPNLARAIERGNYITIGWNLRSLDTVIKDEKRLLQKLLRGSKPGGIILLHDKCEVTVKILRQLITELRARGFQISRLDKMLKLTPYA